MGKREDLYARVTETIVGQLETADPSQWRAPWHAAGGGLPTNVNTNKPYRGVNVWLLLAAEMEAGYVTHEWATYKQWAAKGAQVRRGEKATTVLLWKPAEKKITAADGAEERHAYLLARSFSVFNAAQVEGYVPTPAEVRPEVERVADVERFLAAAGVEVRHGGDRAYYTPALDSIQLPPLTSFSSAVGYYGTYAHETVHATGHESRVGRDLSGRFGTAAYAAEELVAELGAAYVLGLVGLASEPRADHAQYIKAWASLLRDDPSALVTAASQAQKAVDWLVARAAEVPASAAA